MGQKVHPYGFRLVSIRKPRSRWFAEGEQYRKQLIEDLQIRKYIADTQRNASISNILIDRTGDRITVTIEASKPGIMIGRGGRDVDRLRRRLEKRIGSRIRVNVEETPEPEVCAQLVAENIAWQIERRVSPRRAMGQAIERAMEHGAEGARCQIAGRIGGAEIARRETMGPEGRVPLHTLRADIDYGVTHAKTAYGNIGVKVWVYKGEILPPKKSEKEDVWAELEAEATKLEGERDAVEVEGEPGPQPEAVVEPEADAGGDEETPPTEEIEEAGDEAGAAPDTAAVEAMEVAGEPIPQPEGVVEPGADAGGDEGLPDAEEGEAEAEPQAAEETAPTDEIEEARDDVEAAPDTAAVEAAQETGEAAGSGDDNDVDA